MRFHLSTSSGNLFSAHGPGFVRVNQQEYRQNLVVTPERVLPGWAPRGFGDLSAQDIEELVGLAPEVAILGTGTRQHFPGPALLRPLISAGIGFEIMDTPAACRTYNVLCAEGRRVVAAVIVRDDED